MAGEAIRVRRRSVAVDETRRSGCVWAVPEGFRAGVTPAVVLAPGAGSGMDSPFLRFFHEGVAAAGLLAVKLDFPYRVEGRRAPDRPEVLERAWRQVLAAVRADPELTPGPVFAGGKSMGGRIASRVAAAGEPLAGLVLLGYPLHPPGRPERLRAEHLEAVRCPMLFVQGSRDRLCALDRLRPVLAGLAGDVRLEVLEGGDHSLEPPRCGGSPGLSLWPRALDAVVAWVRARG